MPNVIPPWLLGIHLTACSITPQSVASDGTLTAGTTNSVIAVINAVRFRQRPTKDNITPVNTRRANNIIIEDNSSIEVECILKANAANALLTLSATYDVFAVSFTRGTETITLYGTRGDLDDGVTSKGKNLITLVVDQIEIGSANANPIIT